MNEWYDEILKLREKINYDYLTIGNHFQDNSGFKNFNDFDNVFRTSNRKSK